MKNPKFSKIFEKSKNLRKFSRGPWEVPGVPWEAHGKFFEYFEIFVFFSYTTPCGAWGGLHTVPKPKTSNPRASPELKIHQKSIKNHDSSSSSKGTDY